MAREEILARVRAATAGATPPEVPRAYQRTGEHRPGAAELVDLLEDRLVDYRSTVYRCPPGQVAETVRAILPDGSVVVPPELPGDWMTGDQVPGAVVDDGTLTAADLDGYAAVVTGCAAAAAETGTIVLDASPDQGRRAISLVPDVHVCVVRHDQIVHTIPELLARLDPRRPLTFISGPSATSDIELNRVEGVHGPRHLHVVLVEGSSGPGEHRRTGRPHPR